MPLALEVNWVFFINYHLTIILHYITGMTMGNSDKTSASSSSTPSQLKGTFTHDYSRSTVIE